MPNEHISQRLIRLSPEGKSRRSRGHVNVQVQYAGMTSVIDTTSETMQLNSPSTLADREHSVADSPCASVDAMDSSSAERNCGSWQSRFERW